MAQSPAARHLQVLSTQAKAALFALFPSATEAFHALKNPQEKVVAFLAIKQLYTQHSMSPSVAFDLMSPFRGQKEISLIEWVTALEAPREDLEVTPLADSPSVGDEGGEESPREEQREEQRDEEDCFEESMPSVSSARSYALDSHVQATHVVKKSLTESVRDIQLTHPKSSALRDKQKWMELARGDFLGVAGERGSQKSSVAQIFSDIDYELYPEDIECMGLSEANRNLLAEELKKMAQVNKALRRL